MSFSKSDEEAATPDQQSFAMLAVTGIATSIDAMAVGASLAFINANIYVIAAAIGFSTFLMVTTGIMVGGALGTLMGKRAELLGGIVLILIGCNILYEQIGAV